MAKKKTFSISAKAGKHLEEILAENFPGRNIQPGRHLSNNILKGGNHLIEMIREGYADQAEKERKAAIGYRANHKAKTERTKNNTRIAGYVSEREISEQLDILEQTNWKPGVSTSQRNLFNEVLGIDE